MSSHSDLHEVGLVATAADEGTELFVIDGAMQMRARGRHALNVNLPPGVYTVRALTGGQIEEQLVVLLPGAPKQVRFDRLLFASPAPLEGTATSHEYHAKFAEQASRYVNQKVGAGGSWVFVMARCWRSAGRTGGPRANPAGEIVLRDGDGLELFDFSRARFEEYPAYPDADPCGGGTVEVPPGLYNLEWPTANGGRLAQTIPALAGWQTQVFLLRRPPEVGATRAAVDLTVFLGSRRDSGAPFPSFHRDNPDRRLSELGRLGLASERQVLSDAALTELVDGKFRDPMLGLYGAHLLLLKANTAEARKALVPRLNQVVNNLRSLFGHKHPDVEALALALGEPGDELVVTVPPMLRRSWSILLDATVEKRARIQDGSLADRAAERVLAEEPWLLWSVAVPTMKGGQEAINLERGPDLLSEIVTRALSPTAREKGAARGSESAQPSEEQQIRRLVRTLGLPRGRVEALVKGHRAAEPARAGQGELQSAGQWATPKGEATNTFSNAYALVVGIDDYSGAGVPSLPRTVRQDAEDVEKLLLDPARCGYAKGSVRSLLGRAATRGAIRDTLDQLKAATNPESTLLLYFSCHGWRLGDGEYLMPADADASSPQRVAETAIPAAEFSDRLKALPVRKLLVVLDCCHAAGVAALKGAFAAGKGGLSGDTYDRLYTGRGRVVLAACAPEEKAVVLHEGDRNSLFTTHLLAGLRGKAASDDGLVKVLGLFEHVQLQVTGRYRAQHPVLKADLQDNFPVARNNALEKGVSGRGPGAPQRYDAFIAHAEQDFDWVFDRLVPALEREGLRHTVSAEALGQYRVTAVENAILGSKYVLLVISPNYTADRLAQLAGILGQDYGVREGKYQLIPVKIGEPAEEVRLGIQALVGVDLTHAGRRYDFEMTKLLNQLHRAPRPW